MNYLAIPAILAVSLVLIGCSGKSEHEQIAAEMVNSMEDMADILVTVQDEETAKKAAVKLESISEDIKKTVKRMETIGDPEEGEEEKIKEKYAARTKAAGEKIFKEMVRIAQLPNVMGILSEVMKDLPVGK